jgi:hypothetical protein
MFKRYFPKEAVFITFFFILLVFVGIFMHYAGYTFFAVGELGRYDPWRDYVEGESCNLRSGDDLYENDFISSELKYLSTNPYQHTYSERIMNGYPIRDSYLANQYTVFNFLNKFLPSHSSINFSALLMLFTSFALGYFIARSLNFNYYYAALLGILSITLPYTSLFEAWSAVLIGYGFIILGLILFYKHDRPYSFVALSVLGAVLIILSSIYQFYLYTAINLILLGLFYFILARKKKFLIMWLALVVVFVISTMLVNFSLTSHYDFLSSSQKINHDVDFGELVKKKRLATDPITWIWGGVSTHHKVVNHFFGVEGGEFLKLVRNRGVEKQGAAYLLLMIVGLYILFRKAKPYVVVVLFWILYSMGILHLALAFIFGEPFISESTISTPLLVLTLGSFAVIYAMREFLEQRIQLGYIGKVIVFGSIGIVLLASGLMLVWDAMVHNRVLPGVISTFLGGIILFLVVKIFRGEIRVVPEKKFLFMILLSLAILFPTGAKLFSCNKPATLVASRSEFYFPQTKFEKAIVENPDIARVAMIQTSVEKKDLLLWNLPVRLGLSTLTGYRNTIFKEYFDLYMYHKILIENHGESSENLFKEFRKTVGYLSNKLSAFQAGNSNLSLPFPTERYFALHGVNGIIGPADLIIENDDWELVATVDRLSLWKDKKKPRDFLFSTESIVIPDEIFRMRYILEDHDFDMYNQVVLSEGVGVAYRANSTSTSTSQFELLEKTDGYRLIDANVKTKGILTFPVTYSKNWEAKLRHSDSTTKILDTLRANHVFLGVEVEPGEGRIELIYNDRPKLWNAITAWGGIFVLLALILGLKRFGVSKNNESSA